MARIFAFGAAVPDKPIINVRRHMDWRRRLLSDVATAALWVVWIYLWIPVVGKLHQILLHHLNLETAAIEALDVVAPIPVVNSVIALLGTSVLLMLWTLLPKRKVTHAHAAVTIEDYARYFALDPKDIQAGRASRICVATHDEGGNLLEIACGAPH